VRMHCGLAVVVMAAGLSVGLASVAMGQGAKDVRMAGAVAPDALPITGITLYRSGVGSFERMGTVQGTADVQLRFKTEQINDILKSMALFDLDGGQIAAVGYGSKEPLERRLASFGVDIADNPSLANLFNRLRGARVKVVTVEGAVSGTVLGVETRPVPGGGGKDSEPIQQPFLNLVTETGIRSINITTVSSFEIADKELAAELGKALAALAEHRADRTKAVDLTLRGDGARRIVVRYVHEMPVWKTSYRLGLPAAEGGGKKGADAGGQPTIQGWAIVENTTDEDWQNVQLSLVAGRPVSFQMDLYEPLFMYRPMVAVPTVPGVTPRAYAGGEAWDDKRELAENLRKAQPAAPAAGGETAAGLPAMRSAGRAVMKANKDSGVDRDRLEALAGVRLSDYAAASQAQAGEIGEVFEYRLKAPVTIERQRSAMIPILSSAFEGRRVSIFNRADSPEHPMRGVEIKNSTGMQLMPGPISVFDGDAYAGDAQIGHIPAGDKRLIAYAVDLDVSTLIKDDNRSTMKKIRIVRGLLEQTSTQRSETGYAFHNKDGKRARTVLVEHTKNDGWDLLEPKKPAEETQTMYRFELPVAAGEKGNIKVVQEHTDRQSVAITGIDMPTLLAYSKNGKVSKAVIDAVQEAARRQGLVGDQERRMQALDAERGTITQDQTRIRENMKTVDKASDLYSRYVKKLGEQESRLEEITTRREEAQREMERLRGELESYLRDLNVE
jgi:hypothetical protein